MKRLDTNDILGAVGIVLLGAGLWLWWPPAALMVCGGVLVAVALLGAITRVLMRGR